MWLERDWHTQFVNALNQHTDVMAQRLAQQFVDLYDFAFFESLRQTP
jgi:hypothetical protein